MPQVLAKHRGRLVTLLLLTGLLAPPAHALDLCAGGDGSWLVTALGHWFGVTVGGHWLAETIPVPPTDQPVDRSGASMDPAGHGNGTGAGAGTGGGSGTGG